MKTWYRAVCENHGEAIHMFVNNIACTQAYLGEYDKLISEWMSAHYGCELSLNWRDDQFENLLEKGYMMVENKHPLGMMVKI